MGGFLHLFDFNQGNMARKARKQKRHVGGLEAPQNSLDCAIGDVTYSNQIEEWSEKNRYPIEASMKKLINEEVSKQSNTRQKAPSIVARLMGVDTFPLDTNSAVQPIAKKNENMGLKFSKNERSRKSTVGLISRDSNSPTLMEFNLSHHIKDRSADRWSSKQNLGNPRRREHPQEEELQKFKKEFETWQAARFKECSRVIGLDCTRGQLLAQEDLNKEKALYATSGRTANERPREPENHTLKARSCERGNFEQHGDSMELFASEQKESLALRSRTVSREFEQSSLMSSSQKQEKSSAPTKIVILKPGLARISNHEESRTSSLDTLEERGSIEDFLEEVKERLKCELQGHTPKRGSVGRGSGIETPFSEKPSDQKLITRHVAKQVRDGVTKDHGRNLLRSESTRSYRSEIQLNGPGSLDFISRDTRNFLSERLSNVLKQETQFDIPIAASSSSALDNEKVKLKKVRDTLKAGNEMSCGEIVNDEQEIQTRSFRHGSDDGVLLRELSPRNLIRSLSAPVSGTSFGKLLLEDRHILTGAHIRRKHEAIENAMVDIRKQRKERFNFKERVSNFRYRFTFRRRLFGKRMQSMVESRCSEHTLMGDIMSGPTVLMNHGDRHENSTEVPPSPASVCSSSLEDFWRPTEHISSMSTLDITPAEDDVVPQVFMGISSNLNDLRKQLNQLKSHGPEDATIEQESNESEMVDLEDPAEAYVRDLLVSSGLYDGSCDRSLFRWDTFAQPISTCVFEEVEESYRDLAKEDGSPMKDHNEKVDHKMLFDLLNEALSTSLGPISTMSRFKRKIIHFSILPTLHGRRLLDHVWEIIHVHLQPLIDKSYCSLDVLVARDLGSTPCFVFTDEEVSDLGREVECLIIGDLVEEIVKDMQLRG
ncbi:uncharacterized protein LOC121263507 isoform X1 [Juglans microcarpa x Juglans regia]|uniref:uncharacterized protein LOC121263507 isoform X1 n=1 Tax=Juglans microcarpa x Juglans regia TaxID=2249226 RepID=UPI001B7EED1A|nr:uncharacterized protein LOC121263507 isoform X1 [Juglans microcarpa x Juglans regia]XP_041022368.1 uncharacterized protein LOC121263507 isoform X1 [Juglans microcarpa x Juglans regia]